MSATELEKKVSELEESLMKLHREMDDVKKELEEEKERRIYAEEKHVVALAERDQADAKLEEWEGVEQWTKAHLALLYKEIADLKKELEEKS